MKITFADPGYDWTPLLWTGSILVLALLVVLVATLCLKYGNPRKYHGFTQHWPAFMLIFVGIYAFIGVGVGGPATGDVVYRERVSSATFTELLDSGFDAVRWSEADEDPSHTFIGVRDGESFKGTLIRNPNAEPGVYEYRVMEWGTEQ